LLSFGAAGLLVLSVFGVVRNPSIAYAGSGCLVLRVSSFPNHMAYTSRAGSQLHTWQAK
jgi:hypothetical protein